MLNLGSEVQRVVVVWFEEITTEVEHIWIKIWNKRIVKDVHKAINTVICSNYTITIRSTLASGLRAISLYFRNIHPL